MTEVVWKTGVERDIERDAEREERSRALDERLRQLSTCKRHGTYRCAESICEPPTHWRLRRRGR